MYASPLERGQLVQLASYYMARAGESAALRRYDQQNMWNVRPDTVVDAGRSRSMSVIRARYATLIASGVDAAGSEVPHLMRAISTMPTW